MTEMSYGPLWRINGPIPSPPLYGLLQAAAAPAAGVTLITDVDLNARAATVQAARELVRSGRVAGVPNDELMAQLYEFVRASDAYAEVSGAPGAGIERWINGVILYPYPFGPASVWDACAIASEAVTKDFGTDLPQPTFSAMTVYLAETCTSYKVWDQDAFKARAVLALSAVQGAAMAKEFLTGEVLGPPAGGLNPYLADGNGTFPGPGANGNTATTPVEALALLEGEIAKSGQFGLLHMSPQMATTLAAYHIVDLVGQVLRTKMGTVVIPDAGYVGGATPVGHTAATGTQEWIYATGTMEVRLSEIFTTPDNVSEALERGTGGASNNLPNSITYRAERYGLLTWDGEVQAAVKADRCLVDCP